MELLIRHGIDLKRDGLLDDIIEGPLIRTRRMIADSLRTGDIYKMDKKARLNLLSIDKKARLNLLALSEADAEDEHRRKKRKLVPRGQLEKDGRKRVRVRIDGVREAKRIVWQNSLATEGDLSGGMREEEEVVACCPVHGIDGPSGSGEGSGSMSGLGSESRALEANWREYFGFDSSGELSDVSEEDVSDVEAIDIA
ncbi:hypothetical protein HDV00_001401 [Rhizophlyctis rosea]|nr:hypothetical protein HDV00_001401 [Rhizophlyctis rosea]